MTWLPNLLTLSRILLLVPIMALLAAAGAGPGPARWAFGLFLAAALSDLADGWAARRLGCAGGLGAFLDPLADKVLANVLLVFLAARYADWVPLWLVLLLLAREFAVQGFRSLAPCVGVVLGTDRLSKLKTFFQLVTAGAVLAGLGWEALAPLARPLAGAALVLAFGAGYVSMVVLFIRNRDLWRRPALVMESR